jgi:cyclase
MAAGSVLGKAYVKGLQEVGEGVYAYLQPDGGWGLSNAGLVADGERTLLIDTLFDLELTGQMLARMRDAVPAAAHIETLVNTHANGDHCYGNQLLRGSRILASRRAAEEMTELPPAAMAALLEQAPQMRALGAFFERCFGAFQFAGIELELPTETFAGELAMQVGERRVELLEVGPAHTRGDTLVHLPVQRLLFSGDILFSQAHPIAWAGPVSNWIVACDRILALEVDLIVPGHGPLAERAAVRELKAYFEYLYEQARSMREQGMSPLQAARAISLQRWADWREPERLVVNIENIYLELAGEGEELDPLRAFEQMAALGAAER